MENISLLEEVWNWIHLHEVNRFFFLLVAENPHLFSLHQAIMENVLDISNDTSTYSLQDFRRGGGACCSNWLSWGHAVRSGVGAVSSRGALGSAPASILPSLPSPGHPALQPGCLCPAPDSSRHYLCFRDSQPAWLRLFSDPPITQHSFFSPFLSQRSGLHHGLKSLPTYAGCFFF